MIDQLKELYNQHCNKISSDGYINGWHSNNLFEFLENNKDIIHIDIIDKDKLEFPCNNLKEVQQNVVSILSIVQNENYHNLNSWKEIEKIAQEIYMYCKENENDRNN